ncbi:hypothetical protein [Streptomyces sp. NPDC000410]|uniref:hypothetical protein n=1 Tax=Streptomyces sp. NPDC000410 TaxID=3154254 RepID=UPI0033173714
MTWVLSTVISLLLRAAGPLIRRGLPHLAMAVMATLCGTTQTPRSTSATSPTTGVPTRAYAKPCARALRHRRTSTHRAHVTVQAERAGVGAAWS